VRVKSLILPAVAAIVVGAIALGLGHSRGGSEHPLSNAITYGRTVRLTIANYAFHPSALTVRAGTTIAVTNADSTAHTATVTSGASDSGTIKPGQTARFTLNRPGSYSYYCQFHAFMTGTIKVVR